MWHTSCVSSTSPPPLAFLTKTASTSTNEVNMEARGGVEREMASEDALEVDSHVGLLVHAITRHEQSCGIVLCAVRALTKALIEPTLDGPKRRAYTAAFVESGAIVSLLQELALYYDRREFVVAALKLLSVILDDRVLDATTLPPVRAFLEPAVQVSKYMANNCHVDCVFELVHMLHKLLSVCVPISSDATSLTDILCQVLVAPFEHTEITLSCFHCLSSLATSADCCNVLTPPVANIVVKKLSACFDQTENNVYDVEALALAALPVALSLAAKGSTESTDSSIPAPLLLQVLFNVSNTRNLIEKEEDIIEIFLGEHLHYIIKEFAAQSPDDQVSATNANNLAFALLWRTHALALLKLNGAASLLAIIEDCFKTKSMLVTNYTRALYQLCTIVPKEATALFGEAGWLPKLFRWLNSLLDRGMDESASMLLEIIRRLSISGELQHSPSGTLPLQIADTIVKNRLQLLLSTQGVVRLIAHYQNEDKKTEGCTSSLLNALGESRALFVHKEHLQLDFVRALLFAYDGVTAFENVQVPKGMSKDLVRLMRSRIEDEGTLTILVALLGKLLKHADPRTEMIDSGVVQVVAKAMHLHHRRPILQDQLSRIMMQSSNELDAKRNADMLRTLLHMWKQSLTPPSDMSSFVDSLELICYVLAALTRIDAFFPYISVEATWTSLALLLRNNIVDREHLPDQVFERIVKCCVFLTENLLHASRLVGHGDDAISDTTEQRKLLVHHLVKSMSVMVSCTNVSKDEEAIAVVGHLLQKTATSSQWAIDVIVDASWPQIASNIFRAPIVNARIINPVVVLTTAFVERHKCETETVELKQLLFDLVECVGRLVEQGSVVNPWSVRLVLRAIDVLAWRADIRPLSSVTHILSVLNRLFQVFVFSTTDTDTSSIVHLCTSITHGLMSDVFLDDILFKLDNIVRCDEISTMRRDKAKQSTKLRRLAAADAMLLADHDRHFITSCHHSRAVSSILLTAMQSDSFGQTYFMTGLHLAPDPARFELYISAIRELSHFNDASLLWLRHIQGADSAIVDRLIDALVDMLTRGSNSPADVVRTSQALLIILREHGNGQKHYISSLQSAGMVSVAMSMIRRHVESRRETDLLASVLELVAYLIEDSRHRRNDPDIADVDIDFLMSTSIILISTFLFNTATSRRASLCTSELFKSVLRSTGIVFCSSVQRSSDITRSILQDNAVRYLVQVDSAELDLNEHVHMSWCWSLVFAVVENHGRLYGEKILLLMPQPAWKLMVFLSCLTDRYAEPSILNTVVESIAVVTNCKGWSQSSLHAQLTFVIESLREADVRPRSKTGERTTFAGSLTHIIITRLSLVLVSMWLGGQIQHPIAFCESCADIMKLSSGLYQKSTLFTRDFYSKVAALTLRLARCAITSIPSETIESVMEDVGSLTVSVMPDDGVVLEAYLELASAAFLESYSSATMPFIESKFPAIMRAVIHNSSQLLSSETSEATNGLENMFDAIAASVLAQWQPPTTILPLLQVIMDSTRILQLLMMSFFKKDRGVEFLFLVATCITDANAVNSFTERFIQNLGTQQHDLDEKLARLGEEEMSLILRVLCSNASIYDDSLVGGDYKPVARSTWSLGVVKSCLRVLKAFVKLKRCAILCVRAGGFRVLYNLIGSSMHDEGIKMLALEVCCYLTSYEETVTDSALSPLLKLLLLVSDTSAHGDMFIRLSFVIWHQCAMREARQITLEMIQLARAHVYKWESHCSNFEIQEVVENLFKLYSTLLHRRTDNLVESPESSTRLTVSQKERVTETQSTIQRTISQLHSIVEYTERHPTTNTSSSTHINFKGTSKRETDLQTDYNTLHDALCRLQTTVETDMNMVQHIQVFEVIIPYLANIVIFHMSSTTSVVCRALSGMSLLSFVMSPRSVLDSIDVTAFLVASRLHCGNSLVFALHAASFCVNIVTEARHDIDYTLLPMLQLVFALMEHYPEDYDITQSCMRCLHVLLDASGASRIISVQPTLVHVINRVFRNHCHDIAIIWSCASCLQRLASVESLTHDRQLVSDSLSILLDVIRANNNHAFLVRTSVSCMTALCRADPLSTCTELQGTRAASALMNLLITHVDDEYIALGSLQLLLWNTISSEYLIDKANYLVEQEHAHIKVLDLCQRHINSLRICTVGVEVLLIFAEMKDDSDTNDEDSTSAIVHRDYLDHGVIQFAFTLFANFLMDEDALRLKTLLLELLYDLLCGQAGRDQFERVRGIMTLKLVIEHVWTIEEDVVLLEASIDCLVNAACSTNYTKDWDAMSIWLSGLAESLHDKHVSPQSVEKIMGILVRLSVHPNVCRDISECCSERIIYILSSVEHDFQLETVIYELLSQLCFDAESVAVLIINDVVSSCLERAAAHAQSGNEKMLHLSLSCVSRLAVNDDCTRSTDEKALRVIVQGIIENPKSSSRLQHIAQEILDRLVSVSPAVGRKATQSRAHALSAPPQDSSRPPERAKTLTDNRSQEPTASSIEKSIVSPFHEILWCGTVFRIRRDPKQKKQDRVFINLSESGDYLLLRNLSSVPPSVERIFVTQLEVMRNEKATTEEDEAAADTSPRRKRTLTKALSLPALVRTVSRSDCIFHVMIRRELVSFETSSRLERRRWEDALEWLVDSINQGD